MNNRVGKTPFRKSKMIRTSIFNPLWQHGKSHSVQSAGVLWLKMFCKLPFLSIRVLSAKPKESTRLAHCQPLFFAESPKIRLFMLRSAHPSVSEAFIFMPAPKSQAPKIPGCAFLIRLSLFAARLAQDPGQPFAPLRPFRGRSRHSSP